MWMIARKATSTPLNANTLCFLVKREESRSFDVFFFFLFGREKKNVQRSWAESRKLEKMLSPVWGMFGAIYNPERKFRGDGPSASKALKKCGYGYLWKDLGFLILKRCGT